MRFECMLPLSCAMKSWGSLQETLPLVPLYLFFCCFCYELVLAINRDFSEPELFKAYRKLLLKVHPDKGGKGLFWNARWILQRRGLGRGPARSQPALQDRFRNKISHKFHTKISHDFSGGAAVVTSCGMVPDSVRDTRSFDFSGLPRHAPETSGKECLLGLFWDLFGTLPRPCLGAV